MAALLRPARVFPSTFVRRRTSGLVMAAAIGLVVGIAVLHVNQLSRATRAGYEIDALERLSAAKQAQNHELEADVASLSSLARVDWEARTRLGLTPAQRRRYMTLNHPVPERQTLPGRFAPAEPPPPEAYEEPAATPLWKRAAKLLPLY
jgi:hypothetical protein